MMAHSYNLTFRRLMQKEYKEFEMFGASLDYTVSKTAIAI